MRTPRSDSLLGKVLAAGGPDAVDDFFRMRLESAKSVEEIAAWCGSIGVPTSDSAVSRAIAAHSIEWRIDRAKLAAEASAEALPEDADEHTARGLRQRAFELSFQELSAKELTALLKERREAEQLALDREKFEAAQRLLKLQEERAAAAAAQAGGGDAGLRPETLAEIRAALGA